MKTKLAAGLCLASLLVCAEVDHRETSERSYPLAAGARLTVENTNGRVQLRTYDGREVRVTVKEHWRADSPEDLAAGRAAVKLAAAPSAAGLRLYVDQPCRCDEGRPFWGRRGYRARFDLVIDVPADAPLEIATINGEIEAEFPPALSADIRFKTFNGQAYTDFDVAALPSAAPRFERVGGKAMYRADKFTGVRIASGGVEHRFETLNGNIRILKRGN